MEEQCTDPYEQQLFAVFESCLVEGQTDLKEEGLQSLCEKLQLDDAGKDMILSLLNKDQPKNAISFRDFRDGLLELLDKSQEKPSADPDHQIIEEESYRAKINDKITTMKYQLGEYINGNSCVGSHLGMSESSGKEKTRDGGRTDWLID